jgi:hypothetical protein
MESNNAWEIQQSKNSWCSTYFSVLTFSIQASINLESVRKKEIETDSLSSMPMKFTFRAGSFPVSSVSPS